MIIGGAALALRYYDRESTNDIDARISTPDSEMFAAAVAEVAAANGWPDDWINSAASGRIPAYGREVEWETISESEGLIVQVAAPQALLAMKLNANRPGRDDTDIAHLMVLCGLRDLDSLEALFDEFYPGDALTNRAVEMVTRILEVGLPS